jgi:anti-sigma factor RsiW
MRAVRLPRLFLLAFALGAALAAAAPAHAQSGLRVPQRGEPGLDPTFARGWLASEYERFNPRMQWSYTFGERGSLGMSLAQGWEHDREQRQVSVFGRYWLSPDWAVSAETLSSEPGGLLRLQDFRIGVQRRF